MSIGVALFYLLYLLVSCLTISRACWCGASLYTMPSGEVPHYQPCLLVWCLIVVHAFCCGASLSAMSIGVVPPCRPCLLIGYLTIGHGCLYGTLLSAMPVGVVPHYRQWYLTIGHACNCKRHFTSRVQMKEGWLQVRCYLYRGSITSDMSTDPVPLSDIPACTVQLYQNACL